VARRLPRPRAGDGQPLALAARKLVGEAVGRVGTEPDAVQPVAGQAPLQGAVGHGVAQGQGLGHQLPGAPARVQAAGGVLEDDLQLAAQVPLGPGESPARQPHLAGLQGLQRQQGAQQRALAAAGFADQADPLARRHPQRDVVEQPSDDRARQQAAAVAQLAHQAVGRQQWRREIGGGRGWARCQRGGGDQRGRLGLARRPQQRPRRPLLDEPALLQHGDAIGHAGHQRQVVADEEEGAALLTHQLAQQRQHLGLAAHVERRGRLVGNQQPWPQGHGDGDDAALALPAREFMGMPAGEACQAHAIQQGLGGAGGLAPCQPAVQAQGLGHLAAQRHQRVQRRHGFLEDQAEHRASPCVHGRLGQGEQVFAIEQHPALGHGPGGQQAGDGQGRERLARARFAHQAEHLAGGQVQVQRLQPLATTERHAQAPQLQQRAHALLRCGSSRSRRPSASRWKASTARATARPGKRASVGDRAVSVCASASMRPQLGCGG